MRTPRLSSISDRHGENSMKSPGRPLKLGQPITNPHHARVAGSMMVDSDLLSSIYQGRLQKLRQRAEECGISKTGSVEVLRAKLICEEVLPNLDLSWEGIQSMSHKEIGEVLKVFGIKSSGSHKERRQRLWLHLNFDSRRLTIEHLAEMSRDDLHELCKKLELDLTGNRTVLMGRVAGVLTSQMNGWGRIKRSLRRNGLQSPMFEVPPVEADDPVLVDETTTEGLVRDFLGIPSEAVLEDASDSLVLGMDKRGARVQGDLLTIQARTGDLDRMVGTILRGHGGMWGDDEKELLLRLAERRGWPLSEAFVRNRVLLVATNIAEVKGARMDDESGRTPLVEDAEDVIQRIRSKISEVDD